MEPKNELPLANYIPDEQAKLEKSQNQLNTLRLLRASGFASSFEERDKYMRDCTLEKLASIINTAEKIGQEVYLTAEKNISLGATDMRVWTAVPVIENGSHADWGLNSAIAVAQLVPLKGGLNEIDTFRSANDQSKSFFNKKREENAGEVLVYKLSKSED